MTALLHTEGFASKNTMNTADKITAETKHIIFLFFLEKLPINETTVTTMTEMCRPDTAVMCERPLRSTASSPCGKKWIVTL